MMGKLLTTVDVAIQSKTWSNPTCRRNESIKIINTFLHAAWERMSSEDKATWESSPLYVDNAKLAYLKTNMNTLLTTAAMVYETWSSVPTSVYPGYDTTPDFNNVYIDYVVNDTSVDVLVSIDNIGPVWCVVLCVERDRLGAQGYQDLAAIVPGWELSNGEYAVVKTIPRPPILTDVLGAAIDSHGSIFGNA